ncbi:MAG: 6-carboxytetrahydropterin synthase QueD [Candidatus Altiarchaeota archaeon]|nr:6-carboxytetrahydropterin synthase QueD [Candidatus Altiarchaeota archaeon]
MKLGRKFHFDAAHYILDAGEKQCEELHGHTYALEVVVEGNVGKNGMVMDFADLKKIVNEAISKLDHKNLNHLFKNPTAENIAQWIFDQLKPKIDVVSVKLWEGEGKWVEVSR